ncbi:DHA1 family L-arabinose/isopropyl-beta-D-thiogalactopyranoside export protein-like MFS transporter/DHA1 family inner membrane transport protein [Kribbella rubisoli]|uniref:DHA1 family L-arabinose/isopropyl-beta-D-thiogalactopyranoside export protein-like MFS transporter/DHA1 family inner membrane transport protein n=1 Tax=Kribbella rubisoli TaxID=3075929 RepID=A0A4Q7WMW4_9ACTN|nr:MFS transporter [Kribbella rubisoli]RZU10609.1 DHA1 family L-arabinose/isopropyl-beta-D-thiogalactopyranoside export protein-like MFS transporter/DHA1 family inner membrane transport protein [Kribbella rubisoli]
MPISPRRAAAALLMLSVGTFTYVTIEVLPIGLLTVMADDLQRSRSQIGLLVSGYAVVVVLTSIPLTRVTGRLPRRTVLGSTLAVVAVANLLAAAAPTYEVLFGARLVTALSQALFWSIAPSIATSLVPEEFRGRAVARISIGAALASVLGVPIGTWIGEHSSWRVPFVATAALGAGLCAATMLLLPHVEGPDGIARRGSAPDSRRYVAVVVTAAIGVTGFMTFNTYVTPFLLDISGFGSNALGPILLASGLGGVAGAVLVGRLLDRHPWGVLVQALVLLAAVLLGLAAVGRWQVPTVILIAVGGLAYSSMAVALQSRTLVVAPMNTSLASAGTNSAYNLGIAAGAFIGGLLIDNTTVRSVALVGGLLLATAALVVLSEPLLARKPAPRPDAHRVCEEPA